jgi:RNA polymerase sigma-70 factor (ECF subfamily)
VNAGTSANFYPATPVPLPAWVRGILNAVTLSADSQSPSELDRADLDQADLAAVREGDGDAYARIIRRHQSAIARQMMRFARDRQALEALVHDCFVEAYLSLRTYRADAPLKHWLARIATRVGFAHWKTERRDRVRLSKLESSPRSDGPAHRSSTDAKELANYLLDQLSPRDRLAITLLHLEGRSVAEAALLAGWSQTMLKVQAYRARKKLRSLLEKQGIDHG